MSDDTYDVDVNKALGALSALDGLEEQGRALKEEYLGDNARYRGWNGDAEHPDDYYRNTQPDDEKTVRSLSETLDAFPQAILAAKAALLASLGSIKGVHADVHDKIEKQKRIAEQKSKDYESDDSGDASGDDESGGGKH